MNILKRLFPSKNALPDYKNLKKTLKGKNGFLFLINDSNNEIKQHFDLSYKNNFNASLFIKILDFKSKFCNEKNIEYYFLIIPDKSLVCKDFLPSKIRLIKRNYDSINNQIPNFANNLDHTHYFKKDSHINFVGGKELSYHYLNYIDNSFKRKDYEKLIETQISIVDRLYVCDLTKPNNWSYSEEEKEKYPNKEVTFFKNKFLIDIKENLPEKFKFDGVRETEYYKNPKGYKDLKVLIFRDSSLNYLKNTLSIYFKEILLYWDHWFFTPELIEWYKPDIILEIRTERFLENNFFKRIC